MSRDQVVHSQRERIVAAFVQMVAKRGYHAVTIADIASTASVSRRAFYQHFRSKEECFIATFDLIFDYLRNLIDEAIEPIEGWPERVVVALGTSLRFYASEPDIARLCLVDALTASPAIAQHYRDVIYSFAPLLKEGRRERKAGKRPLPGSTEDSLLGAVTSLIGREVAEGKTRELEALTEEMAVFLLTPYVGPDLATEVVKASS